MKWLKFIMAVVFWNLAVMGMIDMVVQGMTEGRIKPIRSALRAISTTDIPQ